MNTTKKGVSVCDHAPGDRGVDRSDGIAEHHVHRRRRYHRRADRPTLTRQQRRGADDAGTRDAASQPVVKRAWAVFRLSVPLRRLSGVELQVAWDVLTPRHRNAPRVIAVPVDLRTTGP